MDENNASARMELCRACLELRGPFFDRSNTCERVQRCACERVPEEPRWYGYDFNCAVELCHLCAAAVVSSGSRWSLFFCGPCQERVLAYDRAVGAAVIPIGRHSLVNNIGLSASQARHDREVVAFADALRAMSNRITVLTDHHRQHVGRLVSSYPGAEGHIPVSDYLLHARATSASRDAVFDELVSSFVRTATTKS